MFGSEVEDRIADWNGLCAYLKSNYAIVDEHENNLNIRVEFGSGGRTNIVQVLNIGKYNVFGECDWIVIRTSVGEQSTIDSADALRRNNDFFLGFLAGSSSNDRVFFMHSLPLLDLEPSKELDFAIGCVAEWGAHLEEVFAGK